MFAQDGEVDVVLDDDGRLQEALEDVAHGDVRPAAQVRGQGHHPAVVVHDAGHTHRNREELVRRRLLLAHEAADRRRHPREKRLRPDACGRRHDAMRQRLAAQVGHGQARPRGAEVDPGHEAVARVELHEGGPPAPARRPGPQLAHDAAPDEMRDEGAHGGSGEAGRLDQLGAREAVRAVHRHHQNAIEVEAPEVAESPPAPGCATARARVGNARSPFKSVSDFTSEGSLRKG
jgi:hypothetical protein